jgi:hypothetical protein
MKTFEYHRIHIGTGERSTFPFDAFVETRLQALEILNEWNRGAAMLTPDGIPRYHYWLK